MGPRVAHLIASSGFYGAERMLLCLAQSLRAANLAEPVIMSLEDSPTSHQEVGRRAESLGLEVCYVPVSNRRFFHSCRELASALAARHIALAHAHGYKGLILGARACRRLGVPLLSTNHGWDAPSWRVRLYQRWEARIMRSLPAVVAVSQAKARQLKAAGVPGGLLTVIPNGIPLPRDRVPAAEPRAKLQIPSSAKVVAMVTRLVPIKGVDLLLQALSRMPNSGRQVRGLIAGDGPLRESLQAQAASLGIAGRVTWLGFMEEIASVYAAADLVVMPSRDEGLPMALLEAMGHGKAVVAADVGGIGEVIRDGENGRLVPAEDPGRLAEALAELLADEGLRLRLGAAARQTVESQFSAEIMAARYADLYQRVLADARGRL